MRSGGIGSMLSNVTAGKTGKTGKPKLSVSAYVSVPYKGESSIPSTKYEKEEYERTLKEVKAIEAALESWIPEDVAERARKSLEAELEVKKAHAQECKARLKRLKAESSVVEDEDEDEESEEDE